MLLSSCRHKSSINSENNNSYYSTGLNPLRTFVGLKPIYPDWIKLGDDSFNGFTIKRWINPLINSKYHNGHWNIEEPCYAMKLLWFKMDVLIQETDIFLSPKTYQGYLQHKGKSIHRAVLNKELCRTYYYFPPIWVDPDQLWNYSYSTSNDEHVRLVIPKIQADSILYSWGLQ
jgi:hypothetical protein